MSKEDAINLITKIQAGRWGDASKISIPMGTIAKSLHESDPAFSLGIEYGAIYGLMISFGINSNDL